MLAPEYSKLPVICYSCMQNSHPTDTNKKQHFFNACSKVWLTSGYLLFMHAKS
jgi:hypothetical protein